MYYRRVASTSSPRAVIREKSLLTTVSQRVPRPSIAATLSVAVTSRITIKLKISIRAFSSWGPPNRQFSVNPSGKSLPSVMYE